MKTCRKFPAGTVLVTAILGAVSLSPSRMAHAGPEKYERVFWDKGDARKVIARTTAIDMGSTSKMLLRITAAALNNEPNRDETTYGVWLTDDVCWSLAVLVQEEKRRTDEEKEKIYEAFVETGACREARHPARAPGLVSAGDRLTDNRNGTAEEFEMMEMYPVWRSPQKSLPAA